MGMVGICDHVGGERQGRGNSRVFVVAFKMTFIQRSQNANFAVPAGITH